jgi:transcriptional regulator with XRE-family HTH domain
MGTVRQSSPSPELITFSNRLQKAIDFNKIDISTLAKSSDYKPDDIHKLLTGMREPGMKKLILLANSLGCSVDYLLGLTPEAKRASVVVQADTDALKGQSSERGQTSGQTPGRIPDKAKALLAVIPQLMESDVELLLYIARFVKERREKALAIFMEAINDKHKGDSATKGSPKPSHEKALTNKGLDEDDLDLDEDLWNGIDDDLEDEDLDEEGYRAEDLDDDFDDDFDD